MARTVTPASDFLLADGRTWKSRGEALLALLSGGAAEVPAGLAGLAGLPMGYDKAAQNVAGVRQAMSYQPRDPSSLEALGRGLEPIGSALERLKRGMGDPVADRMGPGAGTAAYMIPDALASLVGARYMPKGGPTMGQMAENISQPRQLHPQRGVIGFDGKPPQEPQMSREQFLGSPRITSNANAADLKPSAIKSLLEVASVPFSSRVGEYVARYSPDGAAVYDGDKAIATYDFGDTLVVDKKYRRSGIATELVYQWRSRYPAPAKARDRTKASQAIQEKVWARMQAERLNPSK